MIVSPQSFKFKSRLGPMREIRGQWSVIMPNSYNSRSVFCSNEIAAHNLEESSGISSMKGKLFLHNLDSNNKEERGVKYERTHSKLSENPTINAFFTDLLKSLAYLPEYLGKIERAHLIFFQGVQGLKSWK